MFAIQPIVSDMLIIVKSREIQRAMQARIVVMQKRRRKHYLAAAHLELVLADDYEAAKDRRLAFRSRLSAASCFWIGGDIERGREPMEVSGKNIQHLPPKSMTRASSWNKLPAPKSRARQARRKPTAKQSPSKAHQPDRHKRSRLRSTRASWASSIPGGSASRPGVLQLVGHVGK